MPASDKLSMLRARTWRGQQDLQWAHAKLNGHRCRILSDIPGPGFTILSSGGEDITAHLLKQCEWARTAMENMPSPTVIEGELWTPGKPASETSRALGADGDASNLQFSMFAANTLPAEATIPEVHALAQQLGLQFAPYCHASHIDYRDMMPSMLSDEIDTDDLEGWVFKNGNMLDWWKFKFERTCDLVATGWVEGKGKHECFVGAILGSLWIPHGLGGYWREVASCSGMNDDTRYAINEDKDLGRVFEVKYQYVGTNGRLVHPRFLRWRDDKNKLDARPEQDEAFEKSLMGSREEFGVKE